MNKAVAFDGGSFGLFVVAEAFLSRTDGTLKGVFVDDAFVCEGFEDGFVFLALSFLLFRLFAATPASTRFPLAPPSNRPVRAVPVPLAPVLTRLTRRPAQLLPTRRQANPVPATPQDFYPIAAPWTARCEEDGISVQQAHQPRCIVCMPEQFLGRCLLEGMHEKEAVQGVGEQGVVG